MVFYITVLRALAAMIITNSHYTGIYPTDIIANGGLLGDVIFFAVSGFCLHNIKLNFGKWYLKRIARVYIAPIVITIVYLILGWYEFEPGVVEFVNWFVYPTQFHFVASIMVCYIPFYFVSRNAFSRKHLELVMLIVLAVYIVVYCTVYDKSYYHIDVVREPMIRFLFFESMLLGAYFKQNQEKFKNKCRISDWVLLIAMFVLYFFSKMLFAKFDMAHDYQILNQIVLFVLLYFILRCIASCDIYLSRLPERIKVLIVYISNITLEIYVVQNEIISRFNVGGFPLNWIIVTASIVIAASLLHFVVSMINKKFDKMFGENI